MKCPKCGNIFKDPGRAKGGMMSKRAITPEQQAKMQAARVAKKAIHTGVRNAI